ncbi:MAG: OmpA family protein [Gammaproteobacteria bacterium]|nr:OmpA family protein [Gammaproteobacteria bacterium]NNM20469.1 OmpA family protein [Gammaproteobacteria bacterium]
MKKLLAIALLGMALPAAQAEVSQTTAQNIGISSGMVVGAVAAGPVGAIIGAAVGAHYADNVKRAGQVPGLKSNLAATSGELEQARTRVARLNRSLFDTRAELAQLGEEMSGLLLERAAVEGLQMEVLYPTGKSKLSDSAKARLQRLAELLEKLPDMTVRLDGYADPRGDASYNEDLSRHRAEAVRDALIAAGIAAERIALHAHGEGTSVSGAGDLDAYAFERMVRVRLFDAGNDATQVAQQD